jgi:hypothetical protein
LARHARTGLPYTAGGEDDGLARGMQLTAQLVDLADQLAVLLLEMPDCSDIPKQRGVVVASMNGMHLDVQLQS